MKCFGLPQLSLRCRYDSQITEFPRDSSLIADATRDGQCFFVQGSLCPGLPDRAVTRPSRAALAPCRPNLRSPDRCAASSQGAATPRHLRYSPALDTADACGGDQEPGARQYALACRRTAALACRALSDSTEAAFASARSTRGSSPPRGGACAASERRHGILPLPRPGLGIDEREPIVRVVREKIEQSTVRIDGLLPFLGGFVIAPFHE